MHFERIKTDILIIGGGTAGCFAALTIASESDACIFVAEKANIRRSGCLAAGVNAINAYITKGQTPQDYVEYAKEDAKGIVREDLLLSMAEKLNEVTEKLEDLGLVIQKDEDGGYTTRGKRNIKINGENIKPILADSLKNLPKVNVMNHINITDYLVEDNQIKGAFGFHVEEKVWYLIQAKAVICTTGGASGLYRPNNPGFSRHKMWYSPFNTGAGYAMGIRSGAEMTTFEMRFIALRCKNTIAPTGTIAQGVGAEQVNTYGENYEEKYGRTTSERVYGTVRENIEGRGPCYLKTKAISKEQEEELYRAYLNMAPSQTLHWMEKRKGPGAEDVEIEGTEPYIVGGHTASGYWVDCSRQTTIHGLYAAGDVAGGCPQKYVSGALAEGEIAAKAALSYIRDRELMSVSVSEIKRKEQEYLSFFHNDRCIFTTDQVEEAMQKVMDQYAGGISSDYQFNQNQLRIAEEKIKLLFDISKKLNANDMDDLMKIYEVRERLEVCQTLIAHLRARKETRWHCFCENMDYPKQSDAWNLYVNSRMENGKLQIIYRELVAGGERYEHSN